MAEKETSFTIRAVDRASMVVLGVAARLETLNKKMSRTSQVGQAFGLLGEQLAPVGNRMAALGDKWGAAFRRISYTGVVVGGAALGMAKFASSAAEAADNIGDIAERYVISTKSLQVFASLLKDSGFSLEDTAAGMGKLKKSMNEALNGDNKSAAAAFAGIGISLEKLKTMKPEELMLAMADAFKGSEKDMAKQAVLLELMGKNGTIFMAAMNKGSGEYRNRLKEMLADGNLLSDQQIAFAGKFADKWARMSRSLEGLKNRLGMQLAERLEPLLDKFQNWLTGAGGKKISDAFDKIFTSENIQSFAETLLALGKVVAALGKAFVGVVNTIGPTATAWGLLGFALAPVGGALARTAKLLWDAGRALVFLGMKIPGVATGLSKIGGKFASLGESAKSSLPGIQAWALRVATFLYPITIAMAAIYSGFQAYEALQRLSKTQDRVAENTGLRNEKRDAYDKELRAVGGDALVSGTKNYDFAQLDQVMKGLEGGGKVAPGTLARLAAMTVDVSGKMKIEVTAVNGAAARITQLQKTGVMDFDASTGPMMMGG